MKFHRTKDVLVIMPRDALMAIFDECDSFDQDETGGRIIGTFNERDGKLALNVTGILESGPQAQRTAVSFFQDGKHQERIFRELEDIHPEIEHLGNWHTHHVNGLSRLSDGDVATYQRTVNHHKHNTRFFYALLVVAKHKTKDPLHRYSVKHYIIHRDDERVYEIPQRLVEIVDTPLLWPAKAAQDAQHHAQHHEHAPEASLEALPERVYDRDIIAEFYKEVRPFASRKLGLYWRGPIELLNGSTVQVVLVEDVSSGPPSYSIVLREAPESLKPVAERLAKGDFPSARSALIITERSCNRALYEQRDPR
jgi:hypothetical protein